ncbi:FAD-binding oxidoreductase [Immundisolibacter sp.]
MSWQTDIAALLPPGLSWQEPVDTLAYRRDTSIVSPGRPELVVRPQDAPTVGRVLAAASRLSVPVYSRGAGSMYAGGVNPQASGLVLDMSGLDRILDIDAVKGVVVLEPGVTFGALLAALEPFGQTIGIVPSTGAAGTVGGAVSAHALGTGSPRFQSMGDQVAGLEVALADGSFIRTGSAAAHGAGFFHRYAIGPDLTGLFIGADGTLGVITKIALWLHPLPAHRETACLGFADYPSAAAFIGELQRKALLENVWYGAGYDAAAVRGRLLGADPGLDPATLPRFTLGLDYGGEPDAVTRDRTRIEALAAHYGGRPQPRFDELYFHNLRRDELYWYSYAGYFAKSRCAMVMVSFATETLPAFLDQAQRWRERHPQFTWASATVLCRRGLHGAVLTFYEEQHQWPDVQQVVDGCTAELVAIGCVPYKSGKLWADQVSRLTEYHRALTRIKAALDPAGVLAPGNLGLGSQ